MPCLVTALAELNEPRYMTPGGIFGSEGDRYIRISLCATEEVLQRAADQIKGMVL